MATENKTAASSGPVKFVTRIWHKRKGCYLYAKDYNIKAFPIGKR